MLFSPYIVRAQEYGISGEIRFTYKKDDFDSEGSTSKQSSIEQRYELNYRNFIYDPRLLTYSLGGTFIKQDGKSDGNTIQAKGKDYDIRLDFLNGTPYPLSLWTLKHTSTSFTPQTEGESYFIKQTIQSFGAEGGFYRRGLPNLRYDFRQDNRESTGGDQPTEERFRNFFLRLDQNWKNTRAEFNYEYQSTLDKITMDEEKSHDILINGTTEAELSPKSKISAVAEFHTNTLTELTEIEGTTSIDYYPSDKFDGHMNTRYNHTIQPGGSGDNFSNAINVTYKISNALLSSGSTSFTYNTGTAGKSTSEALNGSLSYSDQIAKDLTFSAGSSLGFNAQQAETLNRTTTNGGLSSTLAKAFPKIKSNISTGGSANYSVSSRGGKNERYNINLAANSNYIKRLTVDSKLEYSIEKTLGDKTVDSDTQDSTSTKELVSDTSLTYFMFFGWRAKLDMKAGALIQHGTVDRELLYTEEILSYLLLRNLYMKTNLRYEYEEEKNRTTPTDTISYRIEFNYRIRSIFVTLKYDWRKVKQESGSSITSHTFLEVTRPF